MNGKRRDDTRHGDGDRNTGEGSEPNRVTEWLKSSLTAHMGGIESEREGIRSEMK